MKRLPTNPFSLPQTSAFEAWRLGTMMTELWFSAATTILWRNWDWMLGWHAPDRRLTAENRRMVEEKLAAAMEVNTAWMKLAAGMGSGWLDPWRSGRQLVTPVHRKASANARRLTRRKR